MALIDEMEKSGNTLFKYRSYIPIPIGIILLLSILLPHFFPKENIVKGIFWDIFCLSISAIGLLLRIFIVGFVPKGTSGRNTKKQVADTLNTTGFYSVVRHPLYLANFFIWLGIALLPSVYWGVAIIVLIYWIYYERIMIAEEGFLKKQFGEKFTKWAEETPAFIPNFSKWKSPNLTFSFKNTLLREHSTFLSTLTSFLIVKLILIYVYEENFYLPKFWLTIFSISLILTIVVKILKKTTKILHLEDR